MAECQACGAALQAEEREVCAACAEKGAHPHLYEPRIPVTPLLIVANVAVFADLMVKAIPHFGPHSITLARWIWQGMPLSGMYGAQIIHWGVNFGPLTLNGELWRLLTSNYIHFSVLHLAVNMWVLWGLGRLAEEVFSSLDYVLLYTFTGIGSSLFSVWLHPQVVSGGASGAVFGIAGVMLGTLRWGHLPVS